MGGGGNRCEKREQVGECGSAISEASQPVIPVCQQHSVSQPGDPLTTHMTHHAPAPKHARNHALTWRSGNMETTVDLTGLSEPGSLLPQAPGDVPITGDIPEEVSQQTSPPYPALLTQHWHKRRHTNIMTYTNT